MKRLLLPVLLLCATAGCKSAIDVNRCQSDIDGGVKFSVSGVPERSVQ